MPSWAQLLEGRDRWLIAVTGSVHVLPAELAIRVHEKFASFLQIVNGDFSAAAGHLDLAGAAFIFLGPNGHPPPEVWQAFAERYTSLAELTRGEQRLNPFDLVLAFGSGWGRTVSRGAGGWSGRWEAAIAAMINQVRASLLVTSHLLDLHFPQFSLSQDDLLELPSYFTGALLGGCDCGHHRRGCGGTCGRGCCFPAHDLGSWDPAKCHLRPFIDQAVRGITGEQILGGAFAESLTFRALEGDGRILCRKVEFKRCPGCGMLYDEPRCPTPGCEPPGGPVLTVARSNWLIRPEQEGGNYREVLRWVCGRRGCKNLYPIRYLRTRVALSDPCPLCGWVAPDGGRPASLTVWARLPEARAGGERGLSAMGAVRRPL